MPLTLTAVLLVLGVTAAVAVVTAVVDKGFVAVPVILLVLLGSAVVGIAAYMVDKSSASQEPKD